MVLKVTILELKLWFKIINQQSKNMLCDISNKIKNILKYNSFYMLSNFKIDWASLI